jgi:hypothetical protein
MQKRFYTFIFILFVSFISFSNKIDRAFKSLKEMNYFDAKKCFEQELKKHVVPSSFGLATIYFRKDNPFHNIDSAYNYIVLAEKNYFNQSSKDSLKFSIYGVNYESILNLRTKIVSVFYEQVEQQNTQLGYEEFTLKFPWYSKNNDAIHKRDSILLTKALWINKSFYYDSIIKNIPNFEYLQTIQDRYELTYFAEQTNSGKTFDYVNFIQNNPNSKYITEAQDNVFENETKSNTVEAFSNYIAHYPTYYNINTAWKKLYKLYMHEYTDERIKKFKKEFPDYPYKDELRRDMDLIKLFLFPFKRGNLYGFMNHKGIEIYSPQYESLSLFSEGLSLAMKNGLYGYVDKLNNVVIPFQYDFASDFASGRAIVEIGGKSGVINRSGKYILPLEFVDLGQYSEGLIYGSKDSLYAFYDVHGNKIIDEQFTDVFPFSKGKAKVVVNGKQAIIDTIGKFLIAPQHKEIFYFTDTLIVYRDSLLYGIKTLSNKIIVKPIYDYISPVVNGRSIIVSKFKLGYLNEIGVKVIKPMYDVVPNYLQVCAFHENIAKVRIKGKYALIDKNGKYILNPEYSGLGEVAKIIAFNKGKQWGYMNIEDKSVTILPLFDFASSFHYGLAVVDVNGLQGVINEKAKWIIPTIFTNVKLIAENFYLVYNGANYGLYSLSGDQLIPLEYDQIRTISHDLLVLNKGDKIFYYHLLDHKLISQATENE